MLCNAALFEDGVDGGRIAEARRGGGDIFQHKANGLAAGLVRADHPDGPLGPAHNAFAGWRLPEAGSMTRPSRLGMVPAFIVGHVFSAMPVADGTQRQTRWQGLEFAQTDGVFSWNRWVPVCCARCAPTPRCRRHRRSVRSARRGSVGEAAGLLLGWRAGELAENVQLRAARGSSAISFSLAGSSSSSSARMITSASSNSPNSRISGLVNSGFWAGPPREDVDIAHATSLQPFEGVIGDVGDL